MFGCFADCKHPESEEEDVVGTASAVFDEGPEDGIWKRLVAEERRYQLEEEKQKQDMQRRANEVRALKKAEEEARVQTQDMAQKVKEAQRALKEEQAHYEELRRERELSEHTVNARRQEAKRLVEERERWVQKTIVMAFLREHGFAHVNAQKKTMMKTSYPLHVAAELGDVRMIDALLKEGANTDLRNSSGKTPMQVAHAKCSKEDSYSNVIDALNAAGKRSRARSGGA